MKLQHGRMSVAARYGWVVAAGLAGLLAAPGSAEAAPHSTPDPDTWGTNGTVRTVVVSGSTVYLGGDFTMVGRITGMGVPIDLATGSPVSSFPQVTWWVRTAVADGAGGWYIGGDFLSVGAWRGTGSPTSSPTAASIRAGTRARTTRSTRWP